MKVKEGAGEEQAVDLGGGMLLTKVCVKYIPIAKNLTGIRRHWRLRRKRKEKRYAPEEELLGSRCPGGRGDDPGLARGKDRILGAA
jgi:hypothetical protein